MAAGFRTQQKFAKKIGIRARHTVSRWESGSIEVPPRRRPSIAGELGTTVAAIWVPATALAAAPGEFERMSPKEFGKVVAACRLRLGLAPSEFAPRIGLKLEKAVTQLEAGFSTHAMRARIIPMLQAITVPADAAAARRTDRASEGAPSPGVERIAIDELFTFAKELRLLADRADDTGRALLRQSMEPSAR